MKTMTVASPIKDIRRLSLVRQDGGEIWLRHPLLVLVAISVARPATCRDVFSSRFTGAPNVGGQPRAAPTRLVFFARGRARLVGCSALFGSPPLPRTALADMEGPAVKRFVTAPSISWPMLTSEHLSGGHRGFPEDADARLTMELLRRRIRLICAGCSEEQSRMTPLRRELPPSRGASRPDPKTGRRIASARTLQSCSHRAVADAARESRSHYPRPLLASVTMVTRLGAGSRVESWRPRW